MKRACILVVDDEPAIRHLVQEILEDENYEAITAANAHNARIAFKKRRPDLVLLDIWMPDCDGITLLKEWIEDGVSGLPVVMISGHGTIDTAVEAIRIGAFDFIEKPLSTAKLLSTVDLALQNARLGLHSVTRANTPLVMVGKSAIIGQLRADIARAAAHDMSVLIVGENGSGRSLAARSLHTQSARRAGPFFALKVPGTTSEELAQQLFGFGRDGEFWSGYLEQARGGTLLLEEIGDMDFANQHALRNVLEQGYFCPVGSTSQIACNVRIMASSSRNLEPAVVSGRFDEELWHQLGLARLYIPSLREHREDVPELIDQFVHWSVESEQLPYRKFSTAALNALRNHNWPGNVAELKMLVRGLLFQKKRGDISQSDVRQALRQLKRPASEAFPESLFDMPLRQARDRFERAYLLHHLERTDGNVGEVANIVEMERTHLYRKLKGLGIGVRKDKEK